MAIARNNRVDTRVVSTAGACKLATRLVVVDRVTFLRASSFAKLHNLRAANSSCDSSSDVIGSSRPFASVGGCCSVSCLTTHRGRRVYSIEGRVTSPTTMMIGPHKSWLVVVVGARLLCTRSTSSRESCHPGARILVLLIAVAHKKSVPLTSNVAISSSCRVVKFVDRVLTA